MRLFGIFNSHQSNAETERKKEMEYRLQIAELKRDAAFIKKEAERCKMEAIRLETAGEHASAVSMAATAANQERNYASAMNTIRTCESLHAQAKTQNALKKMMRSCTVLSETVRAEVDVEGIIKAQTEMQRAMDTLEQSREALEAVQEGFDTDEAYHVRDEAGEEALARIMTEIAPIEQTKPIQEAEKNTQEKDTVKTNGQTEWIKERQRMLAEMIG